VSRRLCREWLYRRTYPVQQRTSFRIGVAIADILELDVHELIQSNGGQIPEQEKRI